MELGTRDPQYAPYADGPDGPFRWRLGVRPLDPADWIELGDNFERELRRKREVQAAHPDTVFVALPEARAACVEVRDAVVEHLLARFPDEYRRVGDAVEIRRLGEREEIGAADRHPLEQAARLVQEDLIVMTEATSGPHAGSLVFAAGSVCFPNRWDLPSKLGLPLAEVHRPVSRLNEQLGDPIDRFFDRLTPAKGFWRLGWGVLDTDDLYQPLDGTAAARPGARHLDDLVIRIERETIRRFPRTGAVLFTIRTYVRPLGAVLDRPEHRARVRRALATMPDDVAAYKQVDVLRPVLSDLLEKS